MIRALAVVALLGMLGGLGWLLAADRGLRVVKIEGELAAAEAEDVRRQIAEALNGRFFTLNVARLRERVLELAWPKEVSVRKVWPDTVVVQVARETLVARWRDGRFLDPSGKLVTALDSPEDVPVFECLLSSPEEAMELYLYLQEMAAAHGLRIRRMAENEIGEWRLSFAEGPTLMLGADRLGERMGRFLAAYPRLLERAEKLLDRVDLRYGDGLAVRWRPQPQDLEPKPRPALQPDPAAANAVAAR